LVLHRSRCRGAGGAEDTSFTGFVIVVTSSRWKRAQEYEQSYWAQQARRITEGDAEALTFYQWRSERLAEELRRLGRSDLLSGEARIAEIGCGPVGISPFFPGARRVAVDPLEPFYRDQPALCALRDPSVEYREGVGEALPLEDGAVELVIMENCIDHTRDVDAVMAEIVRVLTPGGVLYLTVNCRTPLGFVVHRALSRLQLDAGHPHTFTAGRARALVEDHPGFKLMEARNGSFWEAFRGDLVSEGMRGRAKALMGVSEFVATVFGERRGG